MENLDNELNYIMSDTIREDTRKVLAGVPEYFWHIPASSTGKYHPDYALGEGGLVRHTKAAVLIAHEMLGCAMFRKRFDDYMRDYIIAALILHDTYKHGAKTDEKDSTKPHNQYSIHEHPLIAAWAVEQTEGVSDGFKQIVPDLIRSHMGEFTTNRYSTYELPLPRTAEQSFVHLCDFLASRKCLEVKFEKA